MKRDWVEGVAQERAIAVVRATDVALGLAMASAVAAGGFRLIEVTWTSQDPVGLVTALRHHLPHCQIGAGTLCTPTAVAEAIAAEAQFCFMPHTTVGLIRVLTEAGIPAIPGALTPTEIITAWQAGASAVKVFPIQAVGGAAYVRHLRGPLGHIPLIPTGGVSLENGRSLIEAGAIAVGLSTALFPPAAIATQDWAAITRRAAQILGILRSPAPDPHALPDHDSGLPDV